MIGNKLFSVPLKVARTFYLNSTLPPSDPYSATLGELVKRSLPRGTQTHFVYKVGHRALFGPRQFPPQAKSVL